MVKKLIKNSTLRIVMALAVVGVLSGALLVVVYDYSIPKIRVNVENETERAIKNIFPACTKIKKTKDDFFKVTGAENKIAGYAFIAEGNGYQGIIKLIIGVDPKLTKMMGLEVLESQETPGLGAEIAGEKFRGQFKNLPITQEIEYVKNQKPDKPNQIEAITGATISSRAVVNIINSGIMEVRKNVKTGGV